ncbi:MAG: ADP-ribosylation factor-like protein [Promethearchaeota archaeon]|jgi:GTPase SAR1 family protein
MENLFKSSIIKGFIFSSYGELGPQPVYTWPSYYSEKELKEIKKEDIKGLTLSLRDVTQISIKNLSLFISDREFSQDEGFQNLRYFAILPYPDFKATSLTYFHYIESKSFTQPVATAFSILVDEYSRSFLYNNINRIKPIVSEFFTKFDQRLLEKYPPQEEIEGFFIELFQQINEIEKNPSTPITSHRKLKLIFAGLDDSGKTSFLLSVDRKYSKLIGLKPTTGANINSIEALGATIFLWDLGGQLKFRRKYIDKAEIYLYEADLIFYFIDIKNESRFEESIDYLLSIKKVLEEFNQDTPIIFILSKGDSDILNSGEIKNNIENIKNRLAEISPQEPPELYVTSIFQIFTILRAFSSGISKLSPNRNLINHNLKNFSLSTKTYLTLLLSEDGLVLADFYSSKARKLTKIPKSQEIINVFEVTAPQFAMLFKIFSRFKALQEEEAIFKVSDSIILFKRIKVAEENMFVLFLIDNEKKKEKINEKLPNFLDQTKELLLRYIG